MTARGGSPRQLPLRFERSRLGRSDYLTGPANAEAVSWLDRWPDWPMPVLAVFGPPGCGKTHLLSALLERSGGTGIRVAALADLDAVALVAEAPLVAIDDAEAAGADRRSEDGLFHLHNAVVSRRRTLLLASRRPPVDWDLATADLRSRLRAAAAVGIGPPDDGLLGGVLRKCLEDRQLPVGDNVIRYLVARMERSFAAADRLADRLDTLSLAEKRQVTVAVAARALAMEASESL